MKWSRDNSAVRVIPEPSMKVLLKALHWLKTESSVAIKPAENGQKTTKTNEIGRLCVGFGQSEAAGKGGTPPFDKAQSETEDRLGTFK